MVLNRHCLLRVVAHNIFKEFLAGQNPPVVGITYKPHSGRLVVVVVGDGEVVFTELFVNFYSASLRLVAHELVGSEDIIATVPFQVIKVNNLFIFVASCIDDLCF